MNVTQIAIGRFHHFHLARQLEKHGLLKAIWTGYPHFKLKEEGGIPAHKIKTFPWVQTPYMMRGRVNLHSWDWLNKEWEWLAQQSLDSHVKASIDSPTTVVALSASGLNAGRKAQKLGGHYICDRGSSHIVFQNEILKEEYKKWGFRFAGIDPRIIDKEEAEYQQCDRITVPSEFVKNSFIAKGVPKQKIVKVVYGARLERFKKIAEPDNARFIVLWVGGVSIRKGFMYLLQAFQQLKHPHKELVVVGTVEPEIKQLLMNQNVDNIQFLGHVANTELPRLYSKAHVFVLPSIEEGLAMVQGEAMGCGCPVIATGHTGAEDIFTNGKEGFIIPVGSAKPVEEALERLAQDSGLREQMSEAAMARVKAIGGWDGYGNAFAKLIAGLPAKKQRASFA